MFTKHLLKVIIGFCGMIILGLISLVVIDHFKSSNEQTATAEVTTPTSTFKTESQFKPSKNSKPPTQTTHTKTTR